MYYKHFSYRLCLIKNTIHYKIRVIKINEIKYKH